MHFHIQWVGRDKIDWARFDSQQEAEEFAKDIVLPDEKYLIQGFGQHCPTCQATRTRSKID